MDLDLVALRATAGKATPGPWSVDSREDGLILGPNGIPVANAEYWATGGPYDAHEHNARFIAVANPQTVLALLDALEVALKA